MYDFHTHSTMSDGALSPVELMRRAQVAGYRVIGITDHVGRGYLERLIEEISEDCRLVQAHWDITALPGVELTHLPPPAIAEAARTAKERGALLVVVHGETIAEPVPQGTNLAAVTSPHVDILAHPGFLTPEEARLAAENGVFLELTARRQHALTNGHVAQVARNARARLIVNSDAHDEGDLLTSSLARAVARGAAVPREELHEVLEANAQALLRKLLESRGRL